MKTRVKKRTRSIRSVRTTHTRYEVTLPELGDDSTDRATVALWLVSEGSIVSENDDLVDMTTDKAAFSVPCPKAGTVVEILVDEGDEVSVGDILCILEL